MYNLIGDRYLQHYLTRKGKLGYMWINIPILSPYLLHSVSGTFLIRLFNFLYPNTDSPYRDVRTPYEQKNTLLLNNSNRKNGIITKKIYFSW